MDAATPEPEAHVATDEPAAAEPPMPETESAPAAAAAAVPQGLEDANAVHDGPTVQQQVAPFLGQWFEDKSHGDVSSLNTFLLACGWGWATRPLLCNAPNQMWVVQKHADDSPVQVRIGVELNALMQKLVQLVGAAPFVRYDCSGAEFEFELFTGVTGYGQVVWEGEALHLYKFIIAPSYVMECHWIYSIVAPAAQPASAGECFATCTKDYAPSHETAMSMAAGESGRVIGEVGEEWTQLAVQRGDAETVGYVPSSFLKLSATSTASTSTDVVEGVPPTTRMATEDAISDSAKDGTTGAAGVDVPCGDREEMWCRQTNRVFKRAAPLAHGSPATEQAPNDGAVPARPWALAERANLKGDAIPEMDHRMHQVWVRARDGDGGILGKLMR